MSDSSVAAGRGVIYIALAKLYFMAAGYVIYFILPRLLGSPVLWGNYLLVVGLVSVINNVLVTATIQAVSRFTAQADGLAQAVKKTAFKVQLLLGGGIALAYVAAAPWIARWERDDSLSVLYRLSAGVTICYAFYAIFIGSLNGLRRFGSQAAFDASFATLRAALILGFAAAGLGVAGAVGGFVTAAATVLLVASLVVGLPRGAEKFPARQLWQFMVKLFVYTFSLNLIMRVDLFLLKRFAGDLSDLSDPAARASLASEFAGYYGTAQTLAFIPYQAILSVAFVIFPLISRSTFEADQATTQAYIRQTLRLSLVFVVGVAVVFIANPEAVINLPYPEKYRIGGPALRLLALGMACFSIFTISNTILNGAGRTGCAIFAGLVALAATAGGNALLIPRASSPEQALIVAAVTTASSMALGMLLSMGLTYRCFAAGVPWRSIARVLVAGAVAVAAGHYIPEVSKLVTLFECFAVLGIYGAALVLLRELDSADLQRFRRVLSRRR